MAWWYTNKVKIPEKQYYVKHQNRTDAPDLAFMVPFGTDKAFDKRKETAHNWATGYDYHTHTHNPPTKFDTFVNTPIAGFELTFDIRNGYRGSPDAWRIRDPRGFVVEIRSDNLAQLIKHAIMDGGRIQNQCVWGREGSRNVLLADGTEEYKEAMRVTQAIEDAKTNKASIAMKDVLPGSMVTIDNGDKYRYLGRFMVYTKDSYQETSPIFNIKKKYVFLNEKKKDREVNFVYTRTSCKIASVDDTSRIITKLEAEKYLHSLVHDSDFHCMEKAFILPESSVVVKHEFKKAYTFGEINNEITSHDWHEKFCDGHLFVEKNGTYFNEAQVRRPNIVPVKDGRKLIGFTMQKGRRPAEPAKSVQLRAQNDNTPTPAKTVEVVKIAIPEGYKLVRVGRRGSK